MRLWHQSLIPYLDRQRLLGQHRECCALRGKGWGKKHATVDYAFQYDPARLVAYHWLVMKEMTQRGYNPDVKWQVPKWRGDALEFDIMFIREEKMVDKYYYLAFAGTMIYPEHNDNYLQECIQLLKDKGAPIDWSVVEQDIWKRRKEENDMAIGVGFANDEKSIEDYYEEELSDAPIGAGGFVKDICYEKAVEQYLENKKDKISQTQEQGFI